MRKDRGFTLIELLIVVAIHRHHRRHRDPEPAQRDRPRQAEADDGRHALDRDRGGELLDRLNFYPSTPAPSTQQRRVEHRAGLHQESPVEGRLDGQMQYECADGSQYTVQSYAKANANDGARERGGGPTQDFAADIFSATASSSSGRKVSSADLRA